MLKGFVGGIGEEFCRRFSKTNPRGIFEAIHEDINLDTNGRFPEYLEKFLKESPVEF